MEGPVFSIIVLVQKFEHLLPLTLDSIKNQKFDSFEILVIGCEQSDQVMQRIKEISDRITMVCNCNENEKAKMMNLGIQLAKGNYLNYLSVGETYVSRHALNYLYELIVKSPEADLVYCGHLYRDGILPPYAVTEPLNFKRIYRSNLPTRLLCCWFSKKRLEQLGGFNTNLHIRPGLDMVCTIWNIENHQILFSKLVLTDYEFHKKSTRELVQSGMETLHIIFKHFGLFHVLIWWVLQDHLHIFKLATRSLKKAFWRA